MPDGVTPEDIDWVIKQLERMDEAFPNGQLFGFDENRSRLVQPLEFLRVKAGPRSELYLRAVDAMKKNHVVTAKNIVAECLVAFVQMSEQGLLQLPVDVQARVTAATDLMEQVDTLLNERRVHPAAPVMLAGAALEEVLRSLVESTGAKPRGKAGIHSYASALRQVDALTPQELKDVTAWAGLRNSAAHGQFDQIGLPNARLMAQGINLFMQRRAPEVASPSRREGGAKGEDDE